MPETDWLLFIAQLPATPSSIRVRTWRKLREAGAASLQNGVWILPRTQENILFLERLLGYVKQNGAGGQIFVVQGLHQTVNEDILERFQKDRDQEYDEFLEQCIAFLQELQKETQRQKFSFAELEENEQNLQRLRKWIGKIQKRDFLITEKSHEAVHALQNCQKSLQAYAQQVYQQEGMDSSLSTELFFNEDELPDREATDDTEP